MIYPIPVVMVSCGTMTDSNIITIAWTGTVNTDEPMAYISIRPERYSYDIIKKSGEFVINLTTEQLVYATDYCGVKSGRNIDKFKEMKLTKEKATKVNCPMIKESPISIECKVKQIIELGSHHMFVAQVLAVNVDDKYFDKAGRFNLEEAKLITYSHGKYYMLGKQLGKFGFSVEKEDKKLSVNIGKNKNNKK